ncbi:hypothetical protein [Streptomyces sp. NPDC020965]|uniref:hypothetical protein n=1 Tax=Streptomyces sp. NPDC020965 TaxID=3365105 RepID=UPI0037B34373
MLPAPGSAPEPPDDPPPAAPRGRTALVVAVVLALLIGGGALLIRADQLRSTPAARDLTLTDTRATAQVTDEIGDAVVRIFSYTPTGVDATRQAARELLAGKAARQYGELFGQVEKRAAGQKLTLTTHVVRIGVVRLTDRSARLLVFLDQVAERAGNPPVTAAAQLTLTAERRDGRWRIVDITSR